MRTLQSLLFSLSLLIFSVPALAQEGLPTQIQNYFKSSQDEFPVEKAYLHLDKFTYTLGDDLWFSAYLVAGGAQLPSPMSKTLYVDLFDGDGLKVAQKIIALENGRGMGDFKIPNFGKTGTYQLKAYTTWMRNFGEDYFFTQQVQVVDGLGGAFLPTVRFNEVRLENSRVRYQVTLEAINALGEPLSNAQISLQAIAGDEELYSQTIQLNAQGTAEFGFSIANAPHPTQHLALSFEESPGYQVTHKLKLPYSLEAADIQFLPEGGNWIIGKKSTIALRAVFPDGTPLVLQGSIEGEERTSFSTNAAGLGKLEFTPQRADYVAVLQDSASGITRRISLPKALQNGLSIHVQNPSDGTVISALIQGVGVPGKLLLVTHTRGLVNYMAEGTLANGIWGVRIPKKNLPSGIHTIAILDEQGKPLLERLVFVQNKDELSLELSASSEPLRPRGKVSLNFKTALQDSVSQASLSLSVVDLDQVEDQSDLQGTLYSHLLLTSDLKGTVYRPGYYFRKDLPNVAEELDLVLLTHGWTRFDWEDVLQNQLPDQGYYIEQGITISGKITEDNPTKKGLGGGKITALVGEGIELLSTEYGPDGNFLLTDLQYQDSVSVTLTAEDLRARNFIDLAIAVPQLPFTQLSGSYPATSSWPKGLAATVGQRNLMQQLNSNLLEKELEGITVQAETLQEEQTQARKIYGEGDAVIKPEDIPGGQGFINIFQLIQGRVAGVRVTFDGFNATVLIRGVGSLQAGVEPMYMLNNVPVDASTLAQVSPRDVESVEVFKDPARTAIFGSQGGNGVIAVYTKAGTSTVYSSVGGTLVTKYSGYSIPRVFYSPKYEENSPANKMTDKRATLYWNPLIQTDKSGKASLSYYNSETASRHLLILEGIDPQGRLGRLVKVIE
ncbi:MAG: TonB-dependent receptor plug domain-containing protein [Algoriphagus sp.]|jgi:TonB-dependent SusC/RagA subfamily outer membrane receptor|nr:TonB-dependent receptor plug domain-containing protein [Algoriphagus sp.]